MLSAPTSLKLDSPDDPAHTPKRASHSDEAREAAAASEPHTAASATLIAPAAGLHSTSRIELKLEPVTSVLSTTTTRDG